MPGRGGGGSQEVKGGGMERGLRAAFTGAGGARLPVSGCHPETLSSPVYPRANGSRMYSALSGTMFDVPGKEVDKVGEKVECSAGSSSERVAGQKS